MPKKTAFFMVLFVSIFIFFSIGLSQDVTDILRSWNRTHDNEIQFQKSVMEYGLPLQPKVVWVKCKGNDVYFLLEIPNLVNVLSTIKSPIIFLNLYIDSDSNPQTGVQAKDIGGVKVSGFDYDVSFSVLVYAEPTKPVVVCRVQKWDQGRKTFSGKLNWGTRFDKSFTEKSAGEFVQLSIPESILEIAKNAKNIRIAFDVSKSKYISGFNPIRTIVLK